ncbi:MAG: TonB-dependent receptor plug domain-containing protein [Flavobacteriaceae bacterium]|nr:TonB-dependent receptor plug domain-containing protein [Flavobacteriaceae bacterium]
MIRILDDYIITILRKNDRILCGYLKDINTQEPLISATIQGRNNSSVSDSSGYFELEVTNETESIAIRFLGYRTINRSIQYFNRNNCAPIYLTAQQESLSQIILPNYLVEGISKLNTGDLEIDFKKFNLLPGLIETDVLQAVQAFPGVQSINETVSNINIRGGSHDQNLILWDDIKMYQSGHFFGLISVFNPQITQKVSLKKNGTSVDYSGGVSGTISMATDKSVNSKFKGNIGASFIDASGFVDVPLGNKSSLQIAARKSLSDIVITPTYEAYFNRISQGTEVQTNMESILNSNQNFDFYDTSLRWNYRLSEKDKIRVNFINIDNQLVFDENTIINSEETSKQSNVSQNSIAGGIYYQRNWNDKLQTSFHIYETDYTLRAINANLLASQRFLQENIVSETGVRLKSSYRLNDRMIWHLGYQFIETEVTNLDDIDVPLIRTLISEVVRTHSGFTQMDLKSRDARTNLNIGFRYNYLDKFNKHLFQPRLSFNQKFANYFSFEIAGEFKHQITSQVINFQNDFLGIEKRRWQLSNDLDIPVIESKQASISINYNRKRWLLSAEGYYKNIDGITTQSQGFLNQYEFVKTDGSYKVSGVDFLIRKRFKDINLWLSYSYMNNEYQFEGLPEKKFPSNLDITQAITFGSTYKYRRLKVSAGLNWHTGKPTTRPVLGNEIVNETINYNATNTDNLNDYLRVDASALYEIELGSMTAHLGFSVWNLLDKENDINNYYRINSDAAAEEFVQTSLGLTPHALIRVYF